MQALHLFCIYDDRLSRFKRFLPENVFPGLCRAIRQAISLKLQRSFADILQLDPIRRAERVDRQRLAVAAHALGDNERGKLPPRGCGTCAA